MLQIGSTEQLVSSMRLAQETGTEAQLIRWLLWLEDFGRAKDTVKIMSDIPPTPSMIYWQAYRSGEKECYYNGGLVYHRSSNEWGVHS